MRGMPLILRDLELYLRRFVSDIRTCWISLLPVYLINSRHLARRRVSYHTGSPLSILAPDLKILMNSSGLGRLWQDSGQSGGANAAACAAIFRSDWDAEHAISVFHSYAFHLQHTFYF